MAALGEGLECRVLNDESEARDRAALMPALAESDWLLDVISISPLALDPKNARKAITKCVRIAKEGVSCQECATLSGAYGIWSCQRSI